MRGLDAAVRVVGAALIGIGVLGLMGTFVGLFTSETMPTVTELLGITGFLLAFVVIGWLLRRGATRRGDAAS